MNLGTMRRRFVGKSLSTKDYVQNGLIAMWDGIENIGIGKHSDNASEWVDLTGNGRNWQLINSAHFDANSLVASNTTSITYSNTIPPDQHVTQEIVFKVISDSKDNTNSRTVILKFGNYYESGQYKLSLNGFSFNRTSGRPHGWMPKTANAVDMNTLVIPKTPICSTVIYAQPNTTNTPPQVVKINGQLKTVGTSDGLGGSASNACGLENGHIYAIRIYNRALTADEISKNFALDKKRFGLNI